MTVGGVENVFVQTLEKLQHLYDITVFLDWPVQEPVYAKWFEEHKNIKLVVFYPKSPFFSNLMKYSSHFPLKNIRKISYSLYKKYRRFKLMVLNKVARDVDLIIDYKNACFWKEIKNINVPKITWVHGSFNFFQNDRCLKNFRGYDKIVCLTDSFRKDFLMKYPEYQDRIIKIYNPIDYRKIAEESKNAEHFGGKYFVCVSRLDVDKDVKTVLLAFDEFWRNENMPDCSLLVIGSGPTERSLKELSETLSAKNNILFLGQKIRPFGYMSYALANILSSYNEGLPTVLIEGAACGVLNISSDCPNGPGEILLAGKGGVLFEPGNYRQLAAIMADVWNDRIDKKTLIENSLNNLKRFDLETSVEQVKSLIENTGSYKNEQ